MEKQKTYTYEEAAEASKHYFAGDELAARVWVNKYAMKDSLGNIYEQSPEDMHWQQIQEPSQGGGYLRTARPFQIHRARG